jgi:hypothetical protein
MSYDMHTVEAADTNPAAGGDTTLGAAFSNFANGDKVLIASYTNVVTCTTGSMSSVAIEFSLLYKNMPPPPKYTVQVTPSVAALVDVTQATSNFTVTL